MSDDSDQTAARMRVAFYMHDLSGGGVERMRLTLIEALAQRRVEVMLVLGSRTGPLVPLLPHGLQVIELGASRTLAAIPRLARFLRDAQPDILVSSLNHNNVAAMVARMLSGSRARLIICQHNALSGERMLGWKYSLVPHLYRLLHRSANAAVAVSRGVANELCFVGGIPRSKISVIYNPVIGFGFDERCECDPPHPWLMKKAEPVFVFVGRLTAQKGLFSLLKAMRLLLDTGKARLIIVGEGEEETGLRKYARQRGIGDAVAFVGFQLNPLPWIKHADALISSSRYEGFGNSIVEALACGTQVIATDCPHGPAEVLLEGDLGTLVPVGDAEALAEAMARVARVQVDVAALRARAARFTAAACAEAHLSLFRRVMAERGRIVHSLGMDISPLSAEEVVNKIVYDRGFAGPRLMVTPNLHHVSLLRKAEFASAYMNAHLVCPDGLPVLLYSRFRGLKLRARVTGCEIFSRLIRHPGLSRHRILFVVESQATESAALVWTRKMGLSTLIDIVVARPELNFDAQAQSALLCRIVAAKPSILVLTLGAPVSEIFVHQNVRALPPCWVLCVGQALRVELRLARRAPVIWQELGLEWLWRLQNEPSRLIGRYARALAWFPIAIWRDLAGREPAQDC